MLIWIQIDKIVQNKQVYNFHQCVVDRDGACSSVFLYDGYLNLSNLIKSLILQESLQEFITIGTPVDFSIMAVPPS